MCFRIDYWVNYSDTSWLSAMVMSDAVDCGDGAEKLDVDLRFPCPVGIGWVVADAANAALAFF